MSANNEQSPSAAQQEFVDLVRSVFNDTVMSVILYGSYLKETYTPGVSDINILIVLSEIRPDDLAVFGRRAGRMMRKHRITPLILSRDEFVSSSDVFPMEYLDIVTTHKVLTGDDTTVDLSINRAHLRHQVEHQLRGHLLSLRQLLVAYGSGAFSNRGLQRELKSWYGSLSAILRGVLRLHGAESIPANDHEIVEELNRAVGLSAGPILELIECRSGTCPDPKELVTRLVDRLATLVGIVDRMDQTAEGH
jgi:predicted nucleotidyltransferase